MLLFPIMGFCEEVSSSQAAGWVGVQGHFSVMRSAYQPLPRELFM